MSVSSTRHLSVILAGGGTAGHVNPLLATARELTQRGHTCHIIGTKEGLEYDLVPQHGYELHVIDRVPFPRRPSAEALAFPHRFRRAVADVKTLIDKTHADVVVGFGGYVSTPAYQAARQAGVGVVIHEQNAHPGLANKLGARYASHVALTFDNTPLHARRGTTSVIGLPLRHEISQIVEHIRQMPTQIRNQCATRYDLDPNEPILLVTGGSLGALSLNNALCQAHPHLPKDIQVIHLTGKGKAQPVQESVKTYGLTRYRVYEYLNDMHYALGCANVVVCRAGAGTVAEMSALGIPAFYVPFPIGNGEQRLNAQDAVQAGGAVLIKDADFQASTVLGQVLDVLSDSSAQKRMSQALRDLGRIDATERLADIVESVC